MWLSLDGNGGGSFRGSDIIGRRGSGNGANDDTAVGAAAKVGETKASA